jgi:PAS domain S-box-containing protein
MRSSFQVIRPYRRTKNENPLEGMNKLYRLFFLDIIKESLANTDNLVGRQRFHLFKLATLFTFLVYTLFLVQISLVKTLHPLMPVLVTVMILGICINHVTLSIHKNQKAASILLLLLLYILLHIVAYNSGGLRNSTMLYIPALLLLSYMLLGKQGGMIMAALAVLHLSFFYFVNRNTDWINYDLLGNDSRIIDFDFFMTAVMSIFMLTIQAGYIERSKNESIQDIQDKNLDILKGRERLQMATQSARIGIWEYDAVNNNLVWDEEMYNIFGVDPAFFTPDYDRWKSIIHEDDREKNLMDLQMSMNTKGEFDAVYRIIRPDGSIRHIQCTGQTQYDKYGKAISMIGTNRDVSARVNNENKIRELNESLEKKIRERTKELVEKKMLLDEAQQMAGIGNWNINFTNKEVIWSDGIRIILGVDYDFKPDFDAFQAFIHPDDLSPLLEKIGDPMRNKELLEDQLRVIRPDKKMRIINSQIRCTFDQQGKTVRIYGTMQDITERKVAEETIRRSEANLHTIFDNTQTCYILLDTNLKILSFNPMALQWSKNALHKELTEGADYISFYPEDRHAPLMAKAKKVLNAETDQYEISYMYPDQSIHNYEAVLSPVLIKDHVSGICIALNDITQKKKSERETQEYVEQLQLKNKNLRQFAFMVSHNLRAPIAKIQGLTYLFEQGQHDENDNLINYIGHEVDNLDHVINDMNAIITTGDMENIVMETVDFQTEFSMIHKVLENQLKDLKAHIHADFSSAPDIISVKSYIYSMMYNLLSNAIKYRSNERVPDILISTSRSDNMICLSVKDNGIGINLEKHKDKIFDLYARVHASSIPGKGMGLSMVKVQAETLGGRVEVDSQIDTGSTFRIFLPVSLS